MNLGDQAVFGLGVSTIAASVAWLAVVGLIDAALRWLVRRKVRKDEDAARGASAPRRAFLQSLDRALLAIVGPLELLLWTIGGLAALGPVAAVAGVGPSTLAWMRGIGTMLAIVWMLTQLGRVIDAAIGSLASRTSNTWDDALLPVAARAARVLLPVLALILGVQALPIPSQYHALLGTGLSIVIIGMIAFLLYQCVAAAEQVVLQRYRLDVRDNLAARAVHTQVTVLRKIAVTLIGVFTLASMLMLFESVRQVGASILASAGIAGIIVGFAAQRSIATLLAGLQIAVTQPIRVDDVVIVENEWGRIEDISLTYVVVRIWDERRLIVPITYFIERPFQNWTRTSAELLGSVFLHVDYRAPVDAMREELTRILRASPLWDGRVNVLQVTEAREHTLEVRALASAADASLAWDLRCEVREKLIRFLQLHHPESLPRVRAEVHPALASAGPFEQV